MGPPLEVITFAVSQVISESFELEVRRFTDSSDELAFKLMDLSLSRSSSLPKQIASKLSPHSTQNAYFIFKEMYLSGTRPSWPLTAPLHQSFDT